MTYPTRLTFEYLWRTIPTLETPKEFAELVAELERRGWHGTREGNFRGMLEAGLKPALKRRVAATRSS